MDKKHLNILPVDKRSEENNSLIVICRGSWVGRREEKLHSFLSSCQHGKDDNSYLFFEDEPTNEYDPNAIMIVSGGEIFGTVGYVAREQTIDIKKILKKAYAYRIDIINENEIGSKNLRLHMEWVSNCDDQKERASFESN